ncbi:MAG: deoxyguanosinetriphosphate triphosphohydrolase [Prevotellaceae bacterium]|jgi:dGTPase|nr:deoxyguanosinetriphosphate triphosphohydrolase [Prevotellaceae bacterium]
MNWTQLLSTKRFGMEAYHAQNANDRTEFQRDYDRLIFSAPFRRLQNKTQVFPLPTTIFVHNRLTHSLEVACVGRSLGTNVAQKLGLDANAIGSIVSAACLAHDMGNPPFGHSGETAIASYFSEGEGLKLKTQMTENEWTDFTHFEGNANALRLLTHQFNGRRKGGFALTYSTLASIIKYPYASIATEKKKFGFFDSEKESFLRIAEELGIPQLADNKQKFARYPLAFLIEAADDICYQIMDIEDAHKLKILSTEETKSLLFSFFSEEQKQRRLEVLKIVQDVNEQIAYLRSSVIGQLVNECTNSFVKNETALLAGTYNTPLIENISQQCGEAYQACSKVAYKKIYCSQEVLDVELSGYKIISTLLEHLIAAVQTPKNAYSKQLLLRIPEQYETKAPTVYGRVQAVLDYVSGMTDVYALDFYRKITGINMN